MGDNYTDWNDIDWDNADWKALRRHLDHRVEVELGIPWSEYEARADLSGTYIRRVRNGNVPRLKETTAAKIERAAQWERGSIASILMGGKPTPTEKKKLAPKDVEPPTVVPVSVEGETGGQSPPAAESEFERFRRWSSFVGQVFTPGAFMQLQQDFATVYREGYQAALQGKGNR